MANFRGPLRIELRSTDDVDQPQQVTFFATEAETGDEREVELRAGRGGVVFAIPVDDVPEVVELELPPNEELRPVHPDARTSAIRADDFTRHG